MPTQERWGGMGTAWCSIPEGEPLPHRKSSQSASRGNSPLLASSQQVGNLQRRDLIAVVGQAISSTTPFTSCPDPCHCAHVSVWPFHAQYAALRSSTR